MPCDKAHIGGLLEEEREGKEREAETGPWGQEWQKIKKKKEREREGRWARPTFYKGI